MIGSKWAALLIANAALPACQIKQDAVGSVQGRDFEFGGIIKDDVDMVTEVNVR